MAVNPTLFEFPDPYYADDFVTLYHADCRELLEHVTADVLITDPRYGVNLGSHRGAAETRRSHVLRKDGYASYEDTPENFDMVVVPAIDLALSRVDRGLVFCAGHMLWKLPQPAVVGGVYLPSACGRNPWGFSSIAPIALYGQAPDLHLGAKATAISSTATTDGWEHPVEKPLAWMRWAVALASRPGECVLDPFAGSGTTLRAAKDLGRKAVGIEIEERYCEVAVRRLGQEVLDVESAA